MAEIRKQRSLFQIIKEHVSMDRTDEINSRRFMRVNEIGRAHV